MKPVVFSFMIAKEGLSCYDNNNKSAAAVKRLEDAFC